MFAHVNFLCRDFMGMESTKVVALLRDYQPWKKNLLHVLKTQDPDRFVGHFESDHCALRARGGAHQATVSIGQHRVTVRGVEVHGVANASPLSRFFDATAAAAPAPADDKA
ncbi:hypothetical protein FB192DRAFT_1443280 [Mucor lusitanicus]|uniref:Uncharacterized protein n=1 Tax=Mucor circinelloides f. lusitanicus TaxID=29924 RepID=A0A8H4BNC9_MUCCL|nr:hypothetical protein FB192DRAFT_1443280 [Mucor lusitanicus]